MTKAIMRFEGIVADFQGDSALAFWGWPKQLDSGPEAACRTVLLIHREFQIAAQNEEGSLTGFQVGVGHGNAIAGKIGSEEQCKVGVFGPVVNLTSRLEGMTKQFRVPILIDEATARYVSKHFSASEARVRKLGRVRPKGIETPLMVSELLPPEGEPGTISNDLLREHEQAVDNFMAHNNYEPPPDWDGVIDLDEK